MSTDLRNILPSSLHLVPLDVVDDVSLAISQQQRHATLKEDLRVSLLLEPIETAPAEGTAFSAYLTNGARVTAERFDDRFVAYDREHPNMFRRPIAASEFCGWIKEGQEAPGGAAEPYALTERQEAAEYIADDMDADRNAGRGEDF